VWSLKNILIFIAAVLLLVYPLIEERVEVKRKKIIKNIFIILIIVNIFATAYSIESQDLKDKEPNPIPSVEKFKGNGFQQNFTLDKTFVRNSTRVYINGLIQGNGESYTENLAAKSIDFSSPPPKFDDILIEYYAEI